MKHKNIGFSYCFGFFSEKKEQRAKKKDFGFFGFLRKEQLTRRLPQPPLHKASASGFAMTGEGEGLRLLKQKAKGSFMLKAKGERLKAVGESRQKQLTRRPFDSAQGDVVEGEAVRVDTTRPQLRGMRQGALGWQNAEPGIWPCGMKDRFTLILFKLFIVF